MPVRAEVNVKNPLNILGIAADVQQDTVRVCSPDRETVRAKKLADRLVILLGRTVSFRKLLRRQVMAVIRVSSNKNNKVLAPVLF